MKLMKNFLYDQKTFTVIYLLACLFLISYYQITTQQAELVYPILLAIFFYLLYMIIQFYHYMVHLRNVDRLTKNSVTVRSSVQENVHVYRAMQELHHRYADDIAKLQRKDMEEKRFISAFIHNLKTPVTVSSIILQRASQQEITQLDALNGLKEENDRMAGQLNSLLDLQRLMEFSNDYQPKAISLEDEIMSLINENKSLFIHNRVYPKVEIKNHMVYTDLKWNRVLINQLISNAVKYSAGEETRYIYFSASKRGDYTDLIIRDQGIGIPEYDLPKIFDAFFTGENGRKGHNSSGIGLYLCKKICDSLGHKITITNEDGCKVTISYLSKL